MEDHELATMYTHTYKCRLLFRAPNTIEDTRLGTKVDRIFAACLVSAATHHVASPGRVLERTTPKPHQTAQEASTR